MYYYNYNQSPAHSDCEISDGSYNQIYSVHQYVEDHNHYLILRWMSGQDDPRTSVMLSWMLPAVSAQILHKLVCVSQQKSVSRSKS